MDIFKPFRMVINKMNEYIEDKKKEVEENAKLEMWKRRLNEAMSSHDTFRNMCAVWDDLYNGSRNMGQQLGRIYMSDRTDKPKQADARQVVNLTFQLIESQIDISVPKPTVTPIEIDDDNEKRDMIEGMLTYLTSGPEMERLTSENERIAKKNSYAIFKVAYDPKAVSHKFRGKIKITNPHPTNIVPQPGVYRVEDMDYLFHIENRTIDYICRMYGEQFREALEDANAEYDYLESFSQSTTLNSDKKGRVSVVEAWYKDKDGDVGVLTWADDVILRDIPKFYYKRDPMGNPIMVETLTVEVGVDPFTQMPIMQEAKVQCHVPKKFPFVIWYNIPKEKSMAGKADPEIIYDQQEGIKKILSIEEEKQIKGTTKILVRRNSGLKDKLTNAISQILETDDPVADVQVIDLKTPDRSLLDLYTIYTQAAKDALGVTEASQGRSENTNLSGKALERLAMYSQGRLSVKTFQKNIAFTELYQLVYDFLLSFYDDEIPYRVEGADNEAKYGYFNKAKLVKQDAAGEWYYPEFDIYIESDIGLPRDKQFILDYAVQQLQAGAIDNIEFWMIMESIDFPNASAILQMEKEKQQQIMMQQQMLAEQQAIQEQAAMQDKAMEQQMAKENHIMDMAERVNNLNSPKTS